jgi:hypothetical protein
MIWASERRVALTPSHFVGIRARRMSLAVFDSIAHWFLGEWVFRADVMRREASHPSPPIPRVLEEYQAGNDCSPPHLGRETFRFGSMSILESFRREDCHQARNEAGSSWILILLLQSNSRDMGREWILLVMRRLYDLVRYSHAKRSVCTLSGPGS